MEEKVEVLTQEEVVALPELGKKISVGISLTGTRDWETPFFRESCAVCSSAILDQTDGFTCGSLICRKDLPRTFHELEEELKSIQADFKIEQELLSDLQKTAVRAYKDLTVLFPQNNKSRPEVIQKLLDELEEELGGLDDGEEAEA